MSIAAISVQPSAVAVTEPRPAQAAVATAAQQAPPAADKVSVSSAAQHAASGDGDHDGH